jgi:DNA-binding CsgD family transcriptional regulator
VSTAGATVQQASHSVIVNDTTSPWAALTTAEKNVAQLVGDGMTNREAAARLFVSRHTVDAHLRHIYRKLDISSRVKLARLVATTSRRPSEAPSAV